MFEQDNETESDQAPVAIFNTERFTEFAALLLLLSDQKNFGARLRSLQSAQAAAIAAEAKLAESRKVHDQIIAKERAEITDLQQRVRKREADILGREGQVSYLEAMYKERLAELHRAQGRITIQHPNGLTQEINPGFERDEVEIEERVIEHNLDPIGGATLTRSPEVVQRPVRRGSGVEL